MNEQEHFVGLVSVTGSVHPANSEFHLCCCSLLFTRMLWKPSMLLET